MYQECFFTQATICYITNLLPSTLSRYITNNNIVSNHINGSVRKKYSYDVTRNIIKHYKFSELSIKQKIHTFVNFKGGTGKTTMCYQLSAFLALCGFNVLVLDCDPQAHLSYSYGIDIYDDYPTLYDIIVNKVDFKECITKICEGLYCLPANLSLTRLELPLSQMLNREKVFKKVIDPIKSQYDFILIDTNPTISILNRNITLASDILNVVCETQPYSMKGLEILMNEIKNFLEIMEFDININIIANKYETKITTSQEVLGQLRLQYKSLLMASVVRKCEDINISVKKQQPILFWGNKNSSAFEDICDLGKEIISNSI